MSVCAYAEDDLDTYYASDPDRWGAPHVAVAPEYPADALEKRVTGVVKVSGIVAPTGQLEAISYSVEPPSATEFVAAVKEVIGHWLFYTPIGKDCMPSEQPVSGSRSATGRRTSAFRAPRCHRAPRALHG
ncbi:MAG TPA: energy transducer TonB [Usitatibacter sp.]|nr:energy transducer TonB [Usitatibacter sp.]